MASISSETRSTDETEGKRKIVEDTIVKISSSKKVKSFTDDDSNEEVEIIEESIRTDKSSTTEGILKTVKVKEIKIELFFSTVQLTNRAQSVWTLAPNQRH